MNGAMDGSFAAFSGFWAAINAALAARGLPEVEHDEARRLWHLAQDEEAAIVWRHLRGRFCSSTCPHEGQP